MFQFCHASRHTHTLTNSFHHLCRAQKRKREKTGKWTVDSSSLFNACLKQIMHNYITWQHLNMVMQLGVPPLLSIISCCHNNGSKINTTHSRSVASKALSTYISMPDTNSCRLFGVSRSGHSHLMGLHTRLKQTQLHMCVTTAEAMYSQETYSKMM